MDKTKDETIKINIPGSYLLVGPAANCEEYTQKIIATLSLDWADIRVVRPEDSKGKTDVTSIEQIREAQSFINLTPVGQYKALILTNAASMQPAAANALLKTLEEPPKYAVVILQSETDNLLPTITSRCHKKTLWQGGPEREQNWNFDKILSEPFYLQSKLIAEVAESQRSLEFLAEFESWAREKLRQERSQDKSRLIKEIINAKRDIRGNLIARIVLETLILRYNHHV